MSVKFLCLWKPGFKRAGKMLTVTSSHKQHLVCLHCEHTGFKKVGQIRKKIACKRAI